MTEQIRVQEFSAHRAGAGTEGAAHSDTRAAMDGTFAAAWQERLSRTPHANFTLSLDYLAHQATRGEPSRAVLLDSEDRHGALVLRATAGELVCGFPWRWQVVFEGADPNCPEGMTTDDALWAFEHAQRLAGNKRLRFFTPCSLSTSRGYLAAHTVMIDVAHSTEEELSAAMDSSRRRLARRSEKQGFQVIEAGTQEMRRDFEVMLADTAERRHGVAPPKSPDPAHLEAASSLWGKPWHWLLVGVKDGVVVAGLGSGRYPNGMVDGRASGSTPEAMKVGTISHVWWESVRQARVQGHSWVNLGGSTVFKRQFGGTLVPIYCRLGGAAWWTVPNALEKMQREGVAFAVKTRGRLTKARPAP